MNTTAVVADGALVRKCRPLSVFLRATLSGEICWDLVFIFFNTCGKSQEILPHIYHTTIQRHNDDMLGSVEQLWGFVGKLKRFEPCRQNVGVTVIQWKEIRERGNVTDWETHRSKSKSMYFIVLIQLDVHVWFEPLPSSSLHLNLSNFDIFFFPPQ